MSPFQNTITSPKLPPKTKTKYEIWGKYCVLEVWLLSFTIDNIWPSYLRGLYTLYTPKRPATSHFSTKFAKFDGVRPFCEQNFSIFTHYPWLKNFDSKKQTCSTKQTHKTIQYCTRKHVEKNNPVWPVWVVFFSHNLLVNTRTVLYYETRKEYNPYILLVNTTLFFLKMVVHRKTTSPSIITLTPTSLNWSHHTQ